jgi:hypothetical protein
MGYFLVIAGLIGFNFGLVAMNIILKDYKIVGVGLVASLALLCFLLIILPLA